MDIDQLIQVLDSEPDDVIEFLERITDKNIQALKDQSADEALQKIQAMAEDVLMLLQTTASGGHLLDVERIKNLANLK